MSITPVERKIKGKIVGDLGDGWTVEINIDDRSVYIIKETEGHKYVYVTFLSPDGTFFDHRGRMWKVVEG